MRHEPARGAAEGVEIVRLEHDPREVCERELRCGPGLEQMERLEACPLRGAACRQIFDRGDRESPPLRALQRDRGHCNGHPMAVAVTAPRLEPHAGAVVAPRFEHVRAVGCEIVVVHQLVGVRSDELARPVTEHRLERGVGLRDEPARGRELEDDQRHRVVVERESQPLLGCAHLRLGGARRGDILGHDVHARHCAVAAPQGPKPGSHPNAVAVEMLQLDVRAQDPVDLRLRPRDECATLGRPRVQGRDVRDARLRVLGRRETEHRRERLVDGDDAAVQCRLGDTFRHAVEDATQLFLRPVLHRFGLAGVATRDGHRPAPPPDPRRAPGTGVTGRALRRGVAW